MYQARPFGSAGGSSEVVFVPSSPEAAEDDGWNLSLVDRFGPAQSEQVTQHVGAGHRVIAYLEGRAAASGASPRCNCGE